MSKTTIAGSTPIGWIPNRCDPCGAPLEINYKVKTGLCIRCGCTYHTEGDKIFRTEPEGR